MEILKKSDFWDIGVSKAWFSEYGASRLRSTTHIPLDDPKLVFERSDAVSISTSSMTTESHLSRSPTTKTALQTELGNRVLSGRRAESRREKPNLQFQTSIITINKYIKH